MNTPINTQDPEEAKAYARRFIKDNYFFLKASALRSCNISADVLVHILNYVKDEILEETTSYISPYFGHGIRLSLINGCSLVYKKHPVSEAWYYFHLIVPKKLHRL